MLNFEIRPSNSADFEQMFEIWVQSQKQATGKRTDEPSEMKDCFRKLFFDTPLAHFYVAESTSMQIVGWQALLPLISNPNIGRYTAQSSTYVSRDFLANDLGSRLFEHAIADAKRLGIDHVYAWVKTDNEAANSIAERFRKHRFKIPGTDGRLPDFYLYIVAADEYPHI